MAPAATAIGRPPRLHRWWFYCFFFVDVDDLNGDDRDEETIRRITLVVRSCEASGVAHLRRLAMFVFCWAVCAKTFFVLAFVQYTMCTVSCWHRPFVGPAADYLVALA